MVRCGFLAEGILLRKRTFDPDLTGNWTFRTMNFVALERTAIVLGSGFFVRAWFSWRGHQRKRKDFEARLVDGAVLEAVFTPQRGMTDDLDLLAEMRDTFSHLNRRAYAQEFWGITDQLITLHDRLEEPQRDTMHRAIIRLISSKDRWLQLIGARTAVRLHLTEGIEPMETLVQDSLGTDLSTETAADKRWREELQDAIEALHNPES